MEYGIMPSQDFVIINKIQQALGINLRKDGKDFSVSPRTLIEKPEKEISEFHGNEIEIFEDE